MSRIHDALKKAAEERAENEMGTIPARVEAPPAISAPRQITERTHAEPEILHGRHPNQVTFQDLLAQCPAKDWKLNPRISELFTSPDHTQGSEELRTLRSRLYQLRDQQPLRTILITSALPAEGKTFLTASLAHMIVRQHERRALIIDADLRHSQMHHMLGAPASPGLTEYLSGAADEMSVLQRGPHENLFFIPGGNAVSSHAELLGSGRLKTLVDWAAPLFDWILIDSPPAILVSDASLMAACCDGVLMVVHAGSTPFDLAQKTRDEFRNKGLLGVVLNQVEAGQTYHSYYYDYSHRAQAKQKEK